MTTFRHILLFYIFLCSHFVFGQKEISLDVFDHLQTEGNFDIDLVYSQTPKVVLFAEKEVLEKVEINQSGKKVTVKDKRWSANTKVKLVAYSDHFNKIFMGGSGHLKSNDTVKESDFDLDLAGSGDIFLSVVTEKLSATVSGSGNIRLEGKTDKMDAKINGSGDLKLQKLTINAVEVKINGSGSACLGDVKESLQSKINGSGDVKYMGNPSKLNVAVNGSGKIIKMEAGKYL